MKMSKILLVVLLFSQYSFAEQLDVNYSSFYGHVKKIDKEETDRLRFAFGFKHIADDRLCKIDDVNIVTQKQTIPLILENNVRFTVPVDKVLKMAKALVSIQFDDNANQCDMSVQLETKPEFLQTRYTYEELKVLFDQYQAFFSNMGGFLSFMMPSSEGLVFHFDKGTKIPSELTHIVDTSGNLMLNKEWFEQKVGLILDSKPLRITALVVK